VLVLGCVNKNVHSFPLKQYLDNTNRELIQNDKQMRVYVVFEENDTIAMFQICIIMFTCKTKFLDVDTQHPSSLDKI
jgi:hypothetical protein